jgi:hypothetical protein
MKPDKTYLFLVLLIFLTAFSWFTSCSHIADIANIPEICFESEVLPIYTNNCAISGCHNGGGRGGSDLVLNNYADILRSVAPFDPKASRSYQAIIAKWGNRMPPSQSLSEANRILIRLWIEQGAALTTCPGTPGGGTATGTAHACFTRDIKPVLVSRCATTGCHDAITHAGDHSFVSYASTMSAVTAGNPGGSRMYQSITGASEEKMPPAGKPQLSAAEIDSIGKWIGYGALNEICAELCDTINPVTFSGTIWPIMQTSCTGCHSGTNPSGNILLGSYSDVATIASSGLLLKSLNGSGVTRMPSGSSFSVCRIRQFEIWVNNGYLNN